MALYFKLPDQRDSLVVMAMAAEQAERWSEMAVSMTQAIKLGPELTSDERNLFAVACHNILTQRRASWRVLSSLEQVELRSQQPRAVPAPGAPRTAQPIDARQYRRIVQQEVLDLANGFLGTIDRVLLPDSSSNSLESKLFYLKLKGDLHRYCCEVSDVAEDHRESATESYNRALELSTTLKPLSPLRLSVAVNASVYFFEVLKAPDRACQIARQAFEDAVNDDDTLDDTSRKESAVSMQILRENIYLWTQGADSTGGLVNLASSGGD